MRIGFGQESRDGGAGRPGKQSGSREASKARPGQSARGAVDARLCPPAGHPRRIYRPGRRAARGLDPFLRCLRRAGACRNRAAFRRRRPASARSRRNLSRARRNRRPALAAEPSAAPDRRGRLAAIDRRHRAARRIAGTGAARPLWRGPTGRRGRDPRGGDRRQHRISAPGLRHQAAGRAISQPLCRRCRPRARRALVGAGRPHPGALRRRLRAGKPAGAVARLHLALQIDECRAGGAVLRGVPRLPCAPAPIATSRASAC